MSESKVNTISNFSQERSAMVERLLASGFTPLPVIPDQGDGSKWGKIPSYYKAGEPTIIKWKQLSGYDRFLRNGEWFTDDCGIALAPSTESKLYCIDLDRKNFSDQKEFDLTVEHLERQCPKLARTWKDRTKSGGIHWYIFIENPPGFKNFHLEPNKESTHLGELIGGSNGVFVISPTVGYESERGFTDEKPTVECLVETVKDTDELGIYSKTNCLGQPAAEPVSLNGDGDFSIKTLLSINNQLLISNGFEGSKDLSKDVTRVLKDILGWIAWIDRNNDVRPSDTGNVIEEIQDIAGYDDGKLNRVWKSITSRGTPEPALPGEDKRSERYFKVAKAGGDIFKDVDDSPLAQMIYQLWRDTPIIFDNKKFWFWQGNYYRMVEPQVVEREVYNWCHHYFEITKGGEKIRPLDSDSASKGVVNQLKKMKFVAPGEMTRLKGDSWHTFYINCTNGVLRCTPDQDGNLQRELLDPTPKLFFPDEPKVAYDPDADRTYAEMLLSSIQENQRDLVLKTLACSFNLQSMRSYIDRVKLLFIEGGGSNGKDSLRVALSEIIGSNCTSSVGIQDFIQYDQGRKFNVSQLYGSCLNWSSENVDKKLDAINSLKAAATGDEIKCEPKNIDEIPFVPKAVMVFNVNKAPKLGTSGSDITTRIAVVNAIYEFALNPDSSKGQVKGIPDFKENPDWRAEKVLPAFLNMLLEAYEDMTSKAKRNEVAIDYSVCQDYEQELKEDFSHLERILADNGIVQSHKGDCISLSRLRAIYLHECWKNGWLDSYFSIPPQYSGKTDKGLQWEDPLDSKFDPLIRNANSMFQALKDKYKRISKQKIRNRNAQETYVYGLKFQNPLYNLPTIVDDGGIDWEAFYICREKGYEGKIFSPRQDNESKVLMKSSDSIEVDQGKDQFIKVDADKAATIAEAWGLSLDEFWSLDFKKH